MVDTNKDLNYAEFQAREKALVIGKRYLNLFHQLHVIRAGLEALNKEFIALPDDVLKILPELSGGAKFFQHIQNLKNGSTPISKIDADLLPFGSSVFETEELFKKYTTYPHKNQPSQSNTSADTEQNAQVEKSINEDEKKVYDLLRVFEATPKFLEKFKSSDSIKEFGPDWKNVIKNLINNSSESDKNILQKNFENLCVFDTALSIWQECQAIIKNPKQRSAEEVKSNLDRYKKYLNMFGKGGQDLYKKIETLFP